MTQIQQPKADNLKLAIGAVLFAVFALSVGDALIKEVSADFSLGQVFVLRSFIALPVLIAIIKIRFRAVSLMPTSFMWTATRSLMISIMWLLYYAALPHVDLSIAASALYTLPLFITLFAGLFIGERVGIQGWIAVTMGFIGVLLILRPQSDDFNVFALLPLISAVLYAFAMILTRTKCKDEHPLVLSFAMNVMMLCAGLMFTLIVWFCAPSPEVVDNYHFLLGNWMTMGVEQWGAMGILAMVIIIGGVGAAIAYQSGPSSIVATYDFFYLAFVTLWGILIFSEVPTVMTFVGMALIVSAGVLAVRRKV